MSDWKAPDGAEAGLEEMRTSVLSDWMGTCSLAFVPEGRTVVVTGVAADEARDRLAELGIEKGVSLQCVRHVGQEVVVQAADGRELILGRREAWVLQVMPPVRVSEMRRLPGQAAPGEVRRWRRERLRKDR